MGDEGAHFVGFGQSGQRQGVGRVRQRTLRPNLVDPRGSRLACTRPPSDHAPSLRRDGGDDLGQFHQPARQEFRPRLGPGSRLPHRTRPRPHRGRSGRKPLGPHRRAGGGKAHGIAQGLCAAPSRRRKGQPHSAPPHVLRQGGAQRRHARGPSGVGRAQTRGFQCLVARHPERCEAGRARIGDKGRSGLGGGAARGVDQERRVPWFVDFVAGKEPTWRSCGTYAHLGRHVRRGGLHDPNGPRRNGRGRRAHHAGCGTRFGASQAHGAGNPERRSPHSTEEAFAQGGFGGHAGPHLRGDGRGSGSQKRPNVSCPARQGRPGGTPQPSTVFV